MSSVPRYSNPSLFDDTTDPQGSAVPQAASNSIPAPDADGALAQSVPTKNSGLRLSRSKVAPKPALAVAVGQKMADGRDEPTYLSVRQLAKRYSVSIATIWRWAKTADGFPKPIELTPGTTRWAAVDLLAFEQRRRGL